MQRGVFHFMPILRFTGNLPKPASNFTTKYAVAERLKE